MMTTAGGLPHLVSLAPLVSLSASLRSKLQQLQPISVLYQAAPAPHFDGVTKPMKPGGYSDSGADIAVALTSQHIHVLTPITPNPSPSIPLDWVYPDTTPSLATLQQQGVRTLWANTILFTTHPLQHLPDSIPSLMVVGQSPTKQQHYDNKVVCHQLLGTHGVALPKQLLVGYPEYYHQQTVHPATIPLSLSILTQHGLSLPLIVKPIRGRGSEGVACVRDLSELQAHVKSLLSQQSRYGSTVMVEEYLPGEELTISVLPPGEYTEPIGQQGDYWCLPLVKRSHSDNSGVMPYSGNIPVVQNSAVVEIGSIPHYQRIVEDCIVTGRVLGLSCVIRIDCRAGVDGRFCLFDVNVKPNMTGAGRVGRDDATSLVALAASHIGWSYPELLINLLLQAKPLAELQKEE